MAWSNRHNLPGKAERGPRGRISVTLQIIPMRNESRAAPMHPEFLQHRDLVYLNHAAVSPWPSRTAEAVRSFAEENRQWGATHYPRWLETETRLRERLAWLIKAPSPKDISLLKNTSEALSVVAYGIDWRPGDRVVTFAQEFPSNRIVWESLARFDVDTRLVDLHGEGSPEERIMAACDEKTRLLSCSSVQYADGTRIDLELLGAFCRKRGILFCVDAIQSLGALPFDVTRTNADFVMADGHKWMMGPEGIALLYTRHGIRSELNLTQFGWHMVERAGDFDRTEWSPAEDGTRFECGSPNMLGIHALDASLSLIQEIGIERIAQRIIENRAILVDRIDDAPGLKLISPREADRQSGIVTVCAEGCDQKVLHKKLMRRHVICACRGGGIRFSPHFYNTERQIKQAIVHLIELIK